ncbi:MAG: zinc ribbon domain-containing protein [Opitutaceae bacterium]|nr:zinc ribbon domain-containing protein [Opitutaceae bacterium]
MVNKAFTPPIECPVCGESVPRGARACPGCGADERSGWDEDTTRYDGLDLPDSAFDDEPTHRPAPRTSRDTLWLVVTFFVLLAIITAFVIR